MSGDWLPADLKRRRTLENRLAAIFEAAGYAGIDVPVVEPAELYLRKFGGQALARIVTFTDGAGRRLSVRPEFTASVVRILAERAPGLPLRWYYLGPVVRLGPDGRVIQFHQAGVELIGVGEPDGDAEVLELLGRALARAGIAGFELRLNHLGIILGLFNKLGLTEPLTTFFIAGLDEIAAGNLPPELRRYLDELAEAEESDGLRDVLAAVGPDGARRLVLSVLENIAAPGRTGRRDLDAIADRLIRRLNLSDELAALRTAIEFARRLHPLRGPAAGVLPAAGRLLAEFGLESGPLTRLGDLAARLESVLGGLGRVSLDLGFSRGLGYYSGLVFEAALPGNPEVRFGGGGRYDGLSAELGGPPAPAIGFSLTVENLLLAGGG